MGKRQAELPNTRRDDEPPPPKTIKALDEACEELERRKGKAIKAGQAIVEQKAVIDGLLQQHGLSWYPYEDLKGVERKVFIKSSIATAKLKKAKVDSDGGDDGGAEE
jgi:hypothetical protein